MKKIGSCLDEKGLWLMVNASLLTGITMLLAVKFEETVSIGFWHVLAAAMTVFILAFFGQLDVRGRILGFAGGMALFAVAGSIVGLRECSRFFWSYIYWLAGNQPWQPEWETGHGILQAVTAAGICYFLAWMMERDFRLKGVGALSLAAVLLYTLFARKEVPKPGVALIFCYLVLVYTEWCQRHWRKVKSGSIQTYMLWVMPFMAVHIVLSMAAVTPKEPYDWKFVKHVYGQAKESFSWWSQYFRGGKGEEYDLALGGFSGSGDIGGGRVQNNKEVMSIRTEGRSAANVYLSGKVYDTFDGRQWEQTDREFSKDRYIDTLETVYAIMRCDGELFEDYMVYTDLQICYRNLYTEYLFAPLKTLNLEQDGKSIDYTENGGSLYFDKVRGYGTEYEVSFYQMNMGQAKFDWFLREAEGQPEDEELLIALLKDASRKNGDYISFGDLEEHKKEILSVYGAPVRISEEMALYLDWITAGEETDLGKLRALEAELASFRYTLTPERLPDTVRDDETFLDYFMSTSKEGYCSHFATAFVLLARAQGYSARYVQGFCVPLKKEGETMVYGDMAHAWPEVYLEGIGWIPFEPTPGYGEIRYTPWAVHDDNSQLSVNQVRTHDKDSERVQTGTQETDRYEETDMEIADKNAVPRLLKIFGAGVCSLICAGVVVFVLNRMIGAYRYARMDLEERFRDQVTRNLKILAIMDMERQEETLEEFRQRIQPLTGREEILSFLEIYEDVLYGNRKVEDADLEETLWQQEELILLLKEKKKRWAYIYYYYL